MKYIKFSILDSPNRQRSVEHFLKKYHRGYNLDGEVFTVPVQNKVDGMKIGLGLRIECIEYFDRKNIELIEVTHKKRRGRPKNAVFLQLLNKGMTINQFQRYTIKEVRKECVTKSVIIKRRILTETALAKAIKTGQLNEIRMGNRSYINRLELATLLRSRKPSIQSLFSNEEWLREKGEKRGQPPLNPK